MSFLERMLQRLRWLKLQWGIHWGNLVREAKPISRIPWSAIRRIGQSRLLALTIIVPFLGSLLLFNQHVVDVLTISPELVKRWLKLSVDPLPEARDLTLKRLYFVYFGLSFLGIGSGLFALLCPLEINSSGTVREFLDSEIPLITKPRMALIVPKVAERYLYWFSEDNFGRASTLTRRLGEPYEFLSLFGETISELYSAMPPDEDMTAAPTSTSHFDKPPEKPIPTETEAEADSGQFYEDPYTNHRGYPDPEKIADALSAQRNVDRGFWYTIQSLAGEEAHRRDVLTLHYMALDHSKPWSRATISLFYVLGFGFMLWPTGLTFVQLAKVFLTR